MVKTFFKKYRLYLLLDTLYHGFRNYRKHITALIFLGFAGSLFEAVGINSFLPLFSFVTGKERTDDLISAYVEKGFLYFNIPFVLSYLIIFICSLFILRAGLLIIANYITTIISADYEEKTRRDLFEKTLDAEWLYLLKQRLGHLETVIMTNVQYGQLLLSHASNVIVITISLIVYIVVAFFISMPVTIATLIFGSILMFLYKPIVFRVKKIAYDVEAINRQVSHHINEQVVGMKTIKITLASKKVFSAGAVFFATLKRLKIKISLLKSIPDALMQPIGLFFISGVFLVSYHYSDFNLAVLAAVFYLIQKMFVYVSQLQSHFSVIGESLPYFREILRLEKEAVSHKEISEDGSRFSFSQELKFQNVSFNYPESKAGVFTINFSLKRGEILGLIGPSGSGKTTIADLLLRLLNPSEGEIIMDSRSINSINLYEWRRNVGYVSQDVFLANDSVLNNIRFYDPSVRDDDIKKAVEMAHADSFIKQLPNDYKTIVGEGGNLLSVGQRQRIIIARVLARKPSLLILDEATSALDNASESAIQKVIEDLKGKLTVVIIAHRLSTISVADRLIALEGGRIVEEGTPEELLERKGSYFTSVYRLMS